MNLRYSIYLLVLLIFWGCKKADLTYQKLTLTFTDNIIYDSTWVILHTTDGSMVYDYTILTDDGVVDFGKIVVPYVSFSIVKLYDYPYSGKYARIYSFLYTPPGNYTFGSESLIPIEKRDWNLELHYPPGNYTQYYAAKNNNHVFSSEVPPEGYLSTTIYGMTPPYFNTLSVYGAVWNENEGFCNWLLDQPPTTKHSTAFNLELTKPMTSSSLSTSKPVYYLSFLEFWNSRQSGLSPFSLHHYEEPQTVHQMHYPIDFPGEERLLCLSGYLQSNDPATGQMFNYRIYTDSDAPLPTAVHIPDYTIAAQYRMPGFSFQIEQASDEIDLVVSEWDEKSYLTQTTVYWKIFSDPLFSSVYAPQLPNALLQIIGKDLSSFGSDYLIRFINYDNIHSFDEYMEKVYINPGTPDTLFTTKYEQIIWKNPY